MAAALAVAPPLPGRPSGFNVTVAGGDALYALTMFGAGLPLAFEAFSWARCTRDAEEPGASDARVVMEKHGHTAAAIR